MTTNEAASPLDPDEPKTPAWLTWLGIGLFSLGGIYLLASGDNEEEAVQEAAEVAENEQTAPSEPPSAEDPTPAPAKANPARPADPHAGHNH